MTTTTQKKPNGAQPERLEVKESGKDSLPQVYHVEFKPATLELVGWEDLIKAAREEADKHRDMVITVDNEAEANTIAATLNKKVKALDAERIKYHKALDAPYKDFEKHIKDAQAPLEEVYKQIHDATKEFAQNRKIEREGLTNALIVMAARSYEVDPETITKRKEWYQMGYKGGELQRQRDIRAAAKDAAQGMRYRFKQGELIKEHAAELHVDPAGWLVALEANGFDVEATIYQMDEAEEQRKQDALKASIDEETGEIVAKKVRFMVEVDEDQADSFRMIMDNNKLKYTEVR